MLIFLPKISNKKKSKQTLLRTFSSQPEFSAAFIQKPAPRKPPWSQTQTAPTLFSWEVKLKECQNYSDSKVMLIF
jgi:hypothetical protein